TRLIALAARSRQMDARAAAELPPDRPTEVDSVRAGDRATDGPDPAAHQRADQRRATGRCSDRGPRAGTNQPAGSRSVTRAIAAAGKAKGDRCQQGGAR